MVDENCTHTHTHKQLHHQESRVSSTCESTQRDIEFHIHLQRYCCSVGMAVVHLVVAESPWKDELAKRERERAI